MTMSVGTSGFQEKTELVKASGKAISSGAASAIPKAAESAVKIVTDQSKVDKTLNKDSVQPINFVLSQEGPIERVH